MGAIQFIENLDRTSLTISDSDFEIKVEESVSVIAERHKEEMPSQPTSRLANHPQISEKSTLSQPEVIPRNSIDAEYSTPQRPSSSKNHVETSHGNDGSEDTTAVSGLLRTIQRPLSSLGRIFSEDPPMIPQRLQGGEPAHRSNQPAQLSPAVFLPPRDSNDESTFQDETGHPRSRYNSQERKINAEDAAARQASAEAAEAHRIQRAEHRDVVELV